MTWRAARPGPCSARACSRSPERFSPDGTKLLALDFRNNSDTSIHLVDLETGDARELTPHEDEGIFVSGPWARDGSGFYLISDAESEFHGLAFYDLASDTTRWVEEPTMDVDDVSMSADGRVLGWIVNDQGTTACAYATSRRVRISPRRTCRAGGVRT